MRRWITRSFTLVAAIPFAILADAAEPPRTRVSKQGRALADAKSESAAQDSYVELQTSLEPPLPDGDGLALTGNHRQNSSNASDDSTAWSLADIEALALANNPSLQQATAVARKAAGFRNQVGIKPNPVVGYSASQLADRGTDQHIAFIEQDIVTGGKLSLNRVVLDHDVQSHQWEAETQQLRVLTDARIQFFAALAAQQRLELTNRFLSVAQQGIDVAVAREKAKEGAMPEILQAEIQLQQVEVQRQQAIASFRGAIQQLNAIAGNSLNPTNIRLEGVLPSAATPLDFESLRSEAIANSPEVQAAVARVSRAQALLRRQQAQCTPNLALMVGAGRDRGTDSEMINAQVGVPLPIYNRNQGIVAAARAELGRSRADLRRIESALSARLAQAFQEFESAAAMTERYGQQIIPRAETTLDMTERAYRAGEFSFVDVLIARRTYFDANLEYLNAQSALARSVSLLDGLGLSGSLDFDRNTELDAALRDQALSNQ